MGHKHWHGLAQAAAPFSDGTPLASQWPIPPKHWFDYELSIPDDSAGTYYYHSHVGFQYVSCSGPLIIEDKTTPPYPNNGERIVYLQELFNKTDASIEQGIGATPGVWSGETNGFLINGDTISNFGLTDSSSQRLSVITVQPNSVYRLRFIGAVSLSYAALGVANHTDLQIIEADGSYTKPHNVSFLQIGSGQRFSALLKTKSCDELKHLKQLDYYIQVESRERPANVTNYAILRYTNDCHLSEQSFKNISTTTYPATKAISLPPTVNGYLDYALQPLKPNKFPSASCVTRRVVINVQQVLDGWAAWQDSNVTWDESAATFPHTTPSQPYLVSLYKNQTAYLPDHSAAVKNGGVDPKTKSFPGKIGEVLEIVIQNIGAKTYDNQTAGGLDVHPWHAHGEHYYDIGGGPGAYDPTTLERQLHGTKPVLRDTTMLFRYNATVKPNEKSGWRAWRLRVQQPGVWMIHCHLLQHMLMGMQTVWIFGDAKDIMALPRPEVSGYLTYGGSAYGNSSHAPQVVHFYPLNGTSSK